MRDGLVAAQPLAIDTVLIDPDAQTVTLVWRAVLAKTPDARIDIVEARINPRHTKLRNHGNAQLALEQRAKRLTIQVINRILGADATAGERADG